MSAQIFDDHGSAEMAWRSGRHSVRFALTDPRRGPVTTAGGPAQGGRLWRRAPLLHPTGPAPTTWCGPSRRAHGLFDPALSSAPVLATRSGRDAEPPLHGTVEDSLLAGAVHVLGCEAVADPAGRLLMDGLAMVLAVQLARRVGNMIGSPPPKLRRASLRRAPAHVGARPARPPPLEAFQCACGSVTGGAPFRYQLHPMAPAPRTVRPRPAMRWSARRAVNGTSGRRSSSSRPPARCHRCRCRWPTPHPRPRRGPGRCAPGAGTAGAACLSRPIALFHAGLQDIGHPRARWAAPAAAGPIRGPAC